MVFPGSYIIQKGETLNNVIQRASGLTIESGALAAIFRRAALKKQEAEKKAQLESETAQIKLTDDEVGSAELIESSALLTKLNVAEATGSLAIDLPLLLTNSLADICLDDVDVLYIAKTGESISVISEVQYATSHLYESDVDFNNYIHHSGGLKTRADQERIYIIKADGALQLASNNNWFSNQGGMLVSDDTIIIPLDLEYKDGPTLWTAVTQIIYNSAVVIAAISGL